ncbi:hypothetical protein OB13_10550 [Pontibacter sp. HJ8]
MSDKINDLMSGLENQSFNIDPTLLAAEILKNSIRSNVYLQGIIGQQLEIKELIKGTSKDFDDIVNEKYDALMEELENAVKSDFLSTIARATKS